jgi:hypothetical protein
VTRWLLLLAVVCVLVYAAVTPSFTEQNTVPVSKIGFAQSDVLPDDSHH